jgi:hypothetical protein
MNQPGDARDRTIVLYEGPKTALALSPVDRSEGVRKAFGTLRKVKKVVGVGSLANFLEMTYSELAMKLARYIGGKVYGKGTLCTWAMVERRERMPRGWFKHYWMPASVEAAFKRMIRDYIHWASDGRYAVSVSGIHRWRVQLRRIG